MSSLTFAEKKKEKVFMNIVSAVMISTLRVKYMLGNGTCTVLSRVLMFVYSMFEYC